MEWRPATSLGDRLRTARRRSGLSVRALGRRLGVSGSAVAQWEARQGSQPAASRLAQIAEVLGVSVDWLLRGTTNEASDPWSTVVSTEFAHSDCEAQLLRTFRLAAPTTRESVLEMLTTCAGARNDSSRRKAALPMALDDA